MQISHTPLLLEESVFILGFPFYTGLTLIPGIVSNLDEVAGKIGMIAAVTQGQAGSPAFNKKGEVAAIVIGTRFDGSSTISVPIAMARSLYIAAGVDQI